MANPKKVLIVDDSRIARNIVQNALKNNFKGRLTEDNFLFAMNGKEALQIIKEQHESLSVVFLDWTMPLMDGLTVVKEVRSRVSETLPIIMITALNSRDAVADAVAAGVNDYITKPFPEKVFIEKLSRVLDLAD